MILLALALAAAASNVPELPKDVPASATMYDILLLEKPAGQMAVWPTPDGKLHAFFQYNDRGRGPKTYTTITLGPDGVPIAEETEGDDYLKDPIHETFAVKDGVASWKNKAESGSRKVTAPAFYVSMFGPPLDGALLFDAALRRGGTLPLLPEGELRVERVVRLPQATLVAGTGLDLQPSYLWVDDQGRFFASCCGWFTMIRSGQEAAFPALKDAQQKAETERSLSQATRIPKKPHGKLVIHDVSVFDAESTRLEPHRDVLIDGNRIISVVPSAAPPPDAQVIDGRGKTLIPGLWDMHAHVGPTDGMLNLAAGVTTVRDLANDNEELAARIARIDKGEEIGTRIVRAGFMDGPGPYQGPTKVLVATPEEAVHWVDWYADHGFVQVKMYSSLKPELVPVVAAEAHRRGLRVSGHIPAYMTAEEAVRQGYDEVQHINMLALNFMPDVKDTRTPARFLEPGRRALDIDLGSEKVRAFIRLLQERHTALDLTLGAFETFYVDRPGKVAVAFAKVADRLPVQLRRGLFAGGLPMQPGDDEKFRASWKRMLELSHALWAAGIPIEAGTDSFPGFGLQRELELDAEARIPAPQILQLATLGAARIMGMDKDFGLVRPGKLADVALIDGDPTKDISQVRKVVLTIKDGVLYDPADLYREMGIAPR
ncbi:MAG: amidohydrolase family protein [Myxococcales bacterium]|nr:amidohydrolase family protein [Myxococcales bacterium]